MAASTASLTSRSQIALNESPEVIAARLAAEAVALSAQQITLSAGELAAAFAMLSTDGQRVTRNDIRDFLAFYLPDLPEKLEKLLLGGNAKEDREIPLSTLIKLMSRKKDMAAATYQDLAKFIGANFHSPTTDGVVMSEGQVAGMVEIMNKRQAIRTSSDFSSLMAALDADNDGDVGVDDWKLLRTICEDDPRVIKLLDRL
ncbi:hypothetical protein BC828DRAFT_391767 [Blastocladiella britannica]|nr:hypothetical protein BC828DRAFT_391767 [Blastocladiella britannica]